MNKKADGTSLVSALIIIAIIIFWISSWFESSNPYNSFMKDCKRINRDKFPCSGIGMFMSNCTSEELNITQYCQDKWTQSKEEK